MNFQVAEHFYVQKALELSSMLAQLRQNFRRRYLGVFGTQPSNAQENWPLTR